MLLKVPKLAPNPLNSASTFMDHLAAFKEFLGDDFESVENKSFSELLKRSIQVLDECPIEKLHRFIPRASEKELACSIITTSIVMHEAGNITPSLYCKLLLLGIRFWTDEELDWLIQAAKLNLLKFDVIDEHIDYYRAIFQCFIKNLMPDDVGSQLEASPGKKLRVAICVSGQLRDYQTAFKTWGFLDLIDHHVDYYIHTWKYLGRRQADRPQHAARSFSGQFLEAYQFVLEQYGFDFIKAQYPALCDFMDKTSQVSEAELQQFYNTPYVVVEDDNNPDILAMSNQQKMLYKIFKCYEYVKSSGKQYDLIIRLRPDKLFEKGKNRVDWLAVTEYSKRTPAVFSVGYTVWLQNGKIAMNDQFAVAAPESFDIYADAYNRSLNGSSGNIIGFEILGHQLFEQGIRIRRLPAIRTSSLSDLPLVETHILRELVKQDSDGRNSETDRVFLAALDGLVS